MLLGAGSFGRVYKGRWRGRDVAVKVMLHGDRGQSERVRSEIALMLSLRHANIVEALHFVAWRRDGDSGAGGGGDDGGGKGGGAEREAGEAHRRSYESGGGDDGGGFVPNAADTYAPSDQAAGSFALSTIDSERSTVVTATAAAGAPPPSARGSPAGGGGGGWFGGGAGGAGAGRAQPSIAEVEADAVSSGNAGGGGGGGGTASGSGGLADGAGGSGHRGSGRPANSRQTRAAAAPGAAGGGGGNGSGEAQTWLVLEYASEGSLADAVRCGLLHSPADAARRPSDGGGSSARGGSGHCARRAPRASLEAAVVGLDLPRALVLLLDVARGMAYLHARNVVHADLKCQNVLLAADALAPWGARAKITDFGLSKALALNQTHVTTHSMGTITHMPPELFK